MRKFLLKTIFSILFLLFFTLLSFVQPSFSQQAASEYEKKLTEISEQITDIRKKISKEEQKKSSILSRLNRIGLNRALIKKEISLYNTQLKKSDLELSSIQKRIPELRQKLDQEEASIKKVLVTLYKFGKFNYFDFLLQVNDIGELISESKNLSLLAQYEDNIIKNYNSTLEELHEAEQALDKKKQEISQLIQKAKEKKQDYSDQESKYNALIREIDRNKETHIQTLEELKDRAEQLQNLIKRLQREDVSLPKTLIPLHERKGKLPWPLSSRKIVTRFGTSRHPRFNTETQNNGVEISPQKDALVKAIHGGRVAYADYTSGYGYMVIIDHGSSYFSIYGHLSSEFMVEKGDYVKTGQSIGVVGDFGSLKSDTLYFEIRYKTNPVNPLQWLE
jgi:septal ring factor EnvC (AmiA/AmiB activator)